MFSQEKLSVQRLCTSLDFQWPISPLTTCSHCMQKAFSLLFFLFFNTAISFLSMPWQTLVKHPIVLFFTQANVKKKIGFPMLGELNLREKNTAEKKQAELTGCSQHSTAHTGGWQFLFFQISFPVFLKRGLVLERDSDWKAYRNKNFLFYRH